MFRRVLVALILLALPAFAADKKTPKYKVAEPRHFTRSEGVELSPGFPDYLYATLTAVLKHKKLFQEVKAKWWTQPMPLSRTQSMARSLNAKRAVSLRRFSSVSGLDAGCSAHTS